MSNTTKGILLVNLGTPDSAETEDVRRFLREFLMDPLVVDLPLISRWLLVHFIISPFRGPKSAKEYQLLWTDKGSPLKTHSEDLTKAVSEKLSDNYHLALAMRYQSPSIKNGLEKLKSDGCDELLIFPLFPQYAEATTLSVLNKVDEELSAMNWSVTTKTINSFATTEAFIKAIVSQAKDIDLDKVDHVLFSYHGLPERQLKKVNADCLTGNCCDTLTDKNQFCYRAQCVATTKALVKKLNIADDRYGLCFQSRQGRIPWIKPYLDEVIVELAEKGAKNILVFSPAFVADCLETTIEIDHTYKRLFLDKGGVSLKLVESLNSSEPWVNAVISMINDAFVEENN